MNELYKVIYTGQLHPDIEKTLVIEKVAALFKISNEKAERFISSGKGSVIKRNLSKESALKYKKKLSSVGLKIDIKIDGIENLNASLTQEKKEKEHMPTNIVMKEKENTDVGVGLSMSQTPNCESKNEKNDKMGFIGLCGRFALWYILSMILLSIILNLIGLKGNSGTAVAIIFISVMLACTAFAKKNQRYLTKNERIKATLGFSFINILFQLIFTSLALIGLSKSINPKIVIITLSIPLLIHTPIIYFSIWNNKKRMIKRGEIVA